MGANVFIWVGQGGKSLGGASGHFFILGGHFAPPAPPLNTSLLAISHNINLHTQINNSLSLITTRKTHGHKSSTQRQTDKVIFFYKVSMSLTKILRGRKTRMTTFLSSEALE